MTARELIKALLTRDDIDEPVFVAVASLKPMNHVHSIAGISIDEGLTLLVNAERIE